MQGILRIHIVQVILEFLIFLSLLVISFLLLFSMSRQAAFGFLGVPRRANDASGTTMKKLTF